MTNSKLDPKPDPRDSPDTPEDNESDILETPEGDGEWLPDEPLKPVPGKEQKTPFIDTNKL
jgi:hypothetical protein